MAETKSDAFCKVCGARIKENGRCSNDGCKQSKNWLPLSAYDEIVNEAVCKRVLTAAENLKRRKPRDGHGMRRSPREEFNE